jgi:hypothetical protein
MTLKDNLEIGLKKDAAFRKDNLPPEQVRGREVSAGPGRSPVIPAAKDDANRAAKDHVKDENREDAERDPDKKKNREGTTPEVD